MLQINRERGAKRQVQRCRNAIMVFLMLGSLVRVFFGRPMGSSLIRCCFEQPHQSVS